MTAVPIDAHMHLWELGGGGYGWLGPQHGRLFRSFGPAEAQNELKSAGVGGAVLVQADDTTADTDFMLDVARDHEWVLGVVGWVPLDDPAAAERELDRLANEPKLRGIRHLVHNDPRDGFLELPEVRRSLELVARRGLAFDVPDAWPRHLGQTVELARALPQLTVVLDHLGKPPLGSADSPDMDQWRACFRGLATLPNTVAKVSGLQLPGVPYIAAALRPLWDEALESFGPSRLMFGGDWPVSTLGAPYARTIGIIRELSADLSPAEQDDILRTTASRVYGLAAQNPPLSLAGPVPKV